MKCLFLWPGALIDKIWFDLVKNVHEVFVLVVWCAYRRCKSSWQRHKSCVQWMISDDPCCLLTTPFNIFLSCCLYRSHFISWAASRCTSSDFFTCSYRCLCVAGPEGSDALCHLELGNLHVKGCEDLIMIMSTPASNYKTVTSTDQSIVTGHCSKSFVRFLPVAKARSSYIDMVDTLFFG